MVRCISPVGSILLLSASLVQAQPTPPRAVEVDPPKSASDQKLPELLEQALKNNPDIRAAEAKLRDAEAELNRARLKALSRVVALKQELHGLQEQLREAEAQYERVRKLHSTGAAPGDQLGTAAAAMQRLRAEHARAEAELPYLLGSGPVAFRVAKDGKGRHIAELRLSTGEAIDPTKLPGLFLFSNQAPGDAARLQHLASAIDIAAAARVQASGQTDKVRAALQEKVKPDFATDNSLKEAVDWLRPHVKGTNLLLQVDGGIAERSVGSDFKLQEAIPVSAVFQWLEDQFPVRCVVRDYGIVICGQDRVPPGAPLLLDLAKLPSARTDPRAVEIEIETRQRR